MYFPSNITFQYFFFDTYPGYFLQVLPIALLVAAIWGFMKYKRDRNTPTLQIFFSCAFVCYLTGLVCLVLLIKVISVGWYHLLYHRSSGINIRLFIWDYNFIPNLFTHLDEEKIGNFIMFLPFGILYPLSKKTVTWKKTILAGLLTSLTIEISQPVFGRAFDINDIILNTLGVLISTFAFYLAAKNINKKY